MELTFLVNEDISQSQTVTIEDHVWEEFSALCDQKGATPIDVIEQFFAWASSNHDAALAWLREAAEESGLSGICPLSPLLVLTQIQSRTTPLPAN